MKMHSARLLRFLIGFCIVLLPLAVGQAQELRPDFIPESDRKPPKENPPSQPAFEARLDVAPFYIAGGPIKIRLELRPSAKGWNKEKTEGDRQKVAIGRMGLLPMGWCKKGENTFPDGVFPKTVSDGRLPSSIRRQLRSSVLLHRTDRSISFCYDLSLHYDWRVGDYEINAPFVSKPLSIREFVAQKDVVVHENVLPFPQDPTTDYNKARYNVTVGTGIVQVSKGDERTFVRIGKFKLATDAEKNASTELLLRLLAGHTAYSYIPVPTDTEIAKAVTDYKGCIWILLQRGKDHCLVVWDSLRKHAFWPYEWGNEKIELAESSFGKLSLTPEMADKMEGKPIKEWAKVKRDFHVVFARRPGMDQVSSFNDLRRMEQTQQIEAEVRKRVVAELKKHGIEPEKPDQRKKGKE